MRYPPVTNIDIRVPHATQELINDAIPYRGVVALTLTHGESVELTNGITVYFSKKRSCSQVGLVILASKDVRISRGFRRKRR
jgi:hypothetical protein